MVQRYLTSVPGGAKLILPEGQDEVHLLYQFDCPLVRWKMVSRETGEVADFDCRSWTCPVHGPLLAWRWRHRLMAVPWQFMLTLTLVPSSRDQARRAWQEVARYLRTQGMRTFVRVLELGDLRGMRHWHVLLEGSWKDEARPLDLDVLRAVAAKAGLGSRIHVGGRGREGWEDSRTKGVTYLLKYLTKGLGVRDPRVSGWRRITASRSVPSWDVVRAKFAAANGEVLVSDGSWKRQEVG